MKPTHFIRRSTIRDAIVLSALLSIFPPGVVLAQKTKAPLPAPVRLPEEEARRLRAEADRDYEIQNHADALAKYLKVYPNYRGEFEINRRIGWLYFNDPLSEFQKATPYLRAAHRLDPSNLDTLHDLARATAWGRLFQESVPLYEELLRASPSVAEYRLEFARTLIWAGQARAAADYYISYLSLSPSDLEARTELGRLLGEQRDFAGAMEQYNYVLRFQPENVEARLRLAQILAWSGELRSSLVEVEKILKSSPAHLDARVVKAFDLLWLGEIDQAKPMFEALTKQDPKNPEIQAVLKDLEKQEPTRAGAISAAPPPLRQAEESEAQGHFLQAIAYYREYLTKSPTDDEARFRLARALGWNKEYAESEAILQEWVRVHPRDLRGFLQLGRVLSWDRKYAEAVEQFRKALKLKPSDSLAHLELAQTLLSLMKYAEALEEYRAALSLHPNSREARLGVAQVLAWSGRLEEARQQVADLGRSYPQDPEVSALAQTIEGLAAEHQAPRASSGESLRETLNRNPENADAHLELADVLLNHKDFSGAIKELRAAAALKPEDDALRLRLAKVLSWNQEYPEAATLYRQWLGKHPDDQQVRIDLARVLSWQRNFTQSEAAYGELLTKDPQRLDLRVELARMLGWAKRYDASLNEFDAILQKDPKNIDAWVGKGRVYAYESKWKQSLLAFNAALKLNPQNFEARTGMAQTLVWSGDAEHARPLLDQLRHENAADSAVLLAMASVQNSLGRPDKALALLDQAAALEPKNSDVRTVRDQIKAGLRPELRLGWSYVRDTESLNSLRYQVMDFRFNLHPRIRNFIDLDVLPSSAAANIFGYGVSVPPGTGPCSSGAQPGCLLFSPRVPMEPFVPSPTLLTASSFPPQVLVLASARIRQSAVQFQAGGTMQVNQWLTWTAGGGVVSLRHGSPDLPAAGFPSSRERFIYSVSPVVRFNRQWGLTLGVSRQYWAYTPKAISQTTHIDEQSASVTWTPDSRSHIALGLYHRGISPEFQVPTVNILDPQSGVVVGTFQGRVFRKHGNGGTLTATRTLWKWERLQFDVGYDAMLFGYTHPRGLPFPEFYLNTGVFTPSFYQRHAGLVHTVWNVSKFLTWDIHGTMGAQQIHQGSNLSFSSTAGSRFDFSMSPKTTLSLAYDYFNTASALQTFIIAGRAVAYHSNNVSATLDLRF